jgi:adenylate kinase family enzyme
MNSVTPAVVAITGPIGSGKTTTAALLARQLAWPKAGYGDTIRAIAAGRGLPASRDHADLVIAAEPLTPPQVTGQIISYLESALGHAPGGRCA